MRFERSRGLFERARQVIPGGIYGHATPALVVPGASPYYAHRAEGARYWDVDGNEFIDLMCAYGPVVLGYRHPGVEAAAQRQAALGDCLNHPARGDGRAGRTPRLARRFRGVGGVRQERFGHDHVVHPGRARAHPKEEDPLRRRGLPRSRRMVHPRTRWAHRGGPRPRASLPMERRGELRCGDEALRRPGRGGGGDPLPPPPLCPLGNAGVRFPGPCPVAVRPPWRGVHSR